jgi:hypothetical protein
MALTTSNRTLYNSPRRLVVQSNLIVDGTVATDLVLVSKAAFTGPSGTTIGKLVVERIEWSLDGLNVKLEFDHTTDDPIANIGGQGFMDFTAGGKYQGFVDPASAGTTGDILATSFGDTVGDTGSITLYLRKKD